eukprot:g1747.t1
MEVTLDSLTPSELEQLFTAACSLVKSDKSSINDSLHLRLYALYKQSHSATLSSERPAGLLNWTAKARWDERVKYKHLGAEESKKLYIQEVSRAQLGWHWTDSHVVLEKQVALDEDQLEREEDAHIEDDELFHMKEDKTGSREIQSSNPSLFGIVKAKTLSRRQRTNSIVKVNKRGLLYLFKEQLMGENWQLRTFELDGFATTLRCLRSEEMNEQGFEIKLCNHYEVRFVDIENNTCNSKHEIWILSRPSTDGHDDVSSSGDDSSDDSGNESTSSHLVLKLTSQAEIKLRHWYYLINNMCLKNEGLVEDFEKEDSPHERAEDEIKGSGGLRQRRNVGERGLLGKQDSKQELRTSAAKKLSLAAGSRRSKKYQLRNVHRDCSSSLLSSESKWQNYRGFLNLASILVFVLNFRLIIENLLQYGFRQWEAFKSNNSGIYKGYLHKNFGKTGWGSQIGNYIFWVSFCIVGQPMAVLLYYYDYSKQIASQEGR